jgi:hypothetical protein
MFMIIKPQWVWPFVKKKDKLGFGIKINWDLVIRIEHIKIVNSSALYLDV